MSNRIPNPSYKPHLALVANDAAWDAHKATVQTYLDDNADSSTVSEETVRAMDSAFDNDRIWAQLKFDMNLFSI